MCYPVAVHVVLGRSSEATSDHERPNEYQSDPLNGTGLEICVPIGKRFIPVAILLSLMPCDIEAAHRIPLQDS